MKEWAGGPSELEVAEVLGLYGPIGISELLIQKIWLRGDFRSGGLRTTDGQRLKVIGPGRWNRLEGPDFLGAEIEIEGRRVLGDVEIHFRQKDWMAHRHEQNPAFQGVVLHVVVFDVGEGEPPAVTLAGRELPTLVLAPILKEGLEAYAMRDALHQLEATDPLDLAAPLLTLPLPQRRARMHAAASLRWQQKRHLAARRLATAGSWSAACHQTVLEILGYRRNRGPMAELALRYPLSTWTAPGEGLVDRIYSEWAGEWRLRGSRPANHPRQRLEQYARVVAANPKWPLRVAELMEAVEAFGVPEESTQAFRRRLKLSSLRHKLLGEIWNGVIASPRADTILIDGLLPLAAEHFGKDGLYAHWIHWWPGDLPDALRIFLRTAQLVTPQWPLSNGQQQAALQCLIEAES